MPVVKDWICCYLKSEEEEEEEEKRVSSHKQIILMSYSLRSNSNQYIIYDIMHNLAN